MPARGSKKVVPFHPRFKKPTSESILKALKPTNKRTTTKYEKILESLVKKFKPLSNPVDKYDWLAQFNETAQSCSCFINESPRSSRDSLGEIVFIYYVKIGDFQDTGINFDDLVEYSKCFFQDKVIKLLPLNIQINFENIKKKNGNHDNLVASYGDTNINLTYRYNNSTDKFQILAQSLHKLLHKIKPKDCCGLIGFTDYDLYAEDSDLFVAGLCNGYFGVGVFSCLRYDPSLKYSEEDWFDYKIKTKFSKMTNKNKSIYLARSCKLLVHETCHLLGIGHCVYMDCCMNGSGNLKEDFRQTIFLCPVDLKKLCLIMNIDIIERYKRLKKFFDGHKCVDESKWLTDVLSSLDN